MTLVERYKIPRAFSGERADKILRQALQEKKLNQSAFTGRSFLLRLFEEERVKVAGEVISSGRRLRSGEVLEFSLPATQSKAKKTPLFYPQEVYENEHFFVFAKPPFMAMHGGKGIREEEYTFADYLLKQYPEVTSIGESPERPGMMHRLDKDTSGIVLIARTEEAYSGLKELFLERKIQKTYLALCFGLFSDRSGVIDFPIRRQRSSL